jgi:tetratricopeptide (TPR) repeat protein
MPRLVKHVLAYVALLASVSVTLVRLVISVDARGQIGQSRPGGPEPRYVATVGTQVILKSFQTPLLEHGHWVPTQDHLLFQVEEIREDKVRLASRDNSVRGWISNDQIVPLDQAIGYLEKVLSQDRRNTEAYWTRARLWLYRDEPERALTNIDLAIRLQPDQARFYLTRSLIDLHEKRFDQAIADCDKAIALDPWARRAFVVRADAWLAKNELKRARADLDQALRLDATTPSAELPVDSSGQRIKAATENRSAIGAAPDGVRENKPEPGNAAELIARGNERYAGGQYNEAIDDYTAAIRLDAACAPAYAARARVWATKHYREREIADYGEAIKIDPKNAVYRVGRADSWSAQGMHDLAVADYNEALRMEPDNPAIWVARAKEWQRDYKTQQAIADFTRAIQLDPRYTPAYIGRGTAFKLSGAFDRAIQEFAELTRVDTENPLAHQTLARILATCTEARFRDGRRALEEATRACELTRWGDPDSLDTLAAACAETGDFASAVKWQTQAIALVRQNVPSALRGPMDLGLRRGIGFEDRLAFYKSRKPTRE